MIDRDLHVAFAGKRYQPISIHLAEADLSAASPPPAESVDDLYF